MLAVLWLLAVCVVIVMALSELGQDRTGHAQVWAVLLVALALLGKD